MNCFTRQYYAFAILLNTLILTGCSVPVIASRYPEGNILVMPVNDAYSPGMPSSVAANSGQYLQNALVNQFDKRANISAQAYVPSQSDANLSRYSNKDSATIAGKMGFDYALVVQLGEFRDALPMTFEDDFVILSNAQLVDASTMLSVWALAAPYRANGGSPGSIYPILDDAAALMSRSVIANFQPKGKLRTSPTAPPILVKPASSELDRQAERLRTIQRLHVEGALTDAEYQQKKKDILSNL